MVAVIAPASEQRGGRLACAPVLPGPSGGPSGPAPRAAARHARGRRGPGRARLCARWAMAVLLLACFAALGALVWARAEHALSGGDGWGGDLGAVAPVGPWPA